MVRRASGPARGRRPGAFAAAAAASALLPDVAHACAVCYGAADDPMIDGTRLSVIFLLGLTYLLLGGGVGLFLLSRRHHRMQRRADAP